MLVAHLGSASTGAAIAGLSGAAAHSAILAWFGGGALAAGGGGMALGSLAIGGLVFLPLVAFSAYTSYKEASRIDDERVRVVGASENNAKSAEKLKSLKSAIAVLEEDFSAKRSNFIIEYDGVREEANALAHKLAKLANSFAAVIDSSSPERSKT